MQCGSDGPAVLPTGRCPASEFQPGSTLAAITKIGPCSCITCCPVKASGPASTTPDPTPERRRAHQCEPKKCSGRSYSAAETEWSTGRRTLEKCAKVHSGSAHNSRADSKLESRRCSRRTRCQGRNKAMHLPIKRDVLDHLAAIRLEGRSEIMDIYAADAAIIQFAQLDGIRRRMKLSAR